MTDREQILAIWNTLSAQDRAAVLATVAEQDAAAANLQGIVSTLRSWGDDADTAVAAWDGWTTAQRFAALKTVIQRFGTMADRMADLLVKLGT